MKRKYIFWINLFLVFILAAGLAVPHTNIKAEAKTKKKQVLIVYFSATGTTKSAAKKIKKATGGKLYQIKAEEPYTDKDLDYNNESCRANTEQNNENARPGISGKVKNIRKYDLIFIGFPIWWGKEPMIIRTFLESYNLEDKKVVTFCTSGGSGISGSTDGIKTAAKGAEIIEGKDLTAVPYKSVQKWVNQIK